MPTFISAWKRSGTRVLINLDLVTLISKDRNQTQVDFIGDYALLKESFEEIEDKINGK